MRDLLRPDLPLLAFAASCCAAGLARMAVWSWRGIVWRVRRHRLSRELRAVERERDREQLEWRRGW